MTLSVEASGDPAPTFAWKKDGVLISGATSKQYTFTASATASYQAVATNSVGSAGSKSVTVTVVGPFTVTSSTVSEGGILPKRFNYDGGNHSIPLQWSGLPAGTQSLVVILDDPDAVPVVGYTWVHWTIVDLPVSAVLGEEADASLTAPARHGLTSGGTSFYGGPCPPSGDHTYRVKLFAMSVPTLEIDLTRTWTRAQFEAAFGSQILGSSELSFLAGASSK